MGQPTGARAVLESVEPRALCALKRGACACLFARRASFCVERVWHNWAESLLCFFLTVEECSEEICLRGRQGFRSHGHGLDVFLHRFVFFKGVLDGAAVNRLGFCGFLAFLLAEAPRLFLPFTCLSSGLRGLVGSIVDAACSETVFCERLWEMTVVCWKWSCIMCRAFVTHSSETCCGFCPEEAVAEESSHPVQALLHPCFHRLVPCHRAWLTSCPCSWSLKRERERGV